MKLVLFEAIPGTHISFEEEHQIFKIQKLCMFSLCGAIEMQDQIKSVLGW